ncbi:MAG: WYL domain-containing transcriptional regulator [Pseudomonadota bacterium]
MDRFDRIYDLHKILSAARYPVSRKRLEDELECSRATVKRIIEAMRLYLNAPIKYDRSLNGYYYDREEEGMYELPGVWFNASELHALLTVQRLLGDVQPGLFEKQLAPLQERIGDLLRVQHAGSDELSRRVCLVHMAARPAGEFFQAIAGATAQRRRLQLTYYSRARDTETERQVSPQRLVYYRDNWYLDAWCHLRKGLRTFALDAIRQAAARDARAKEVPQAELDDHYASAYGIFSGRASHLAVLRFTSARARWVAEEQWHPDQAGRWLDDGRYELRIPYHDPRELVMDILRHGGEVEVVEPAALRKQVAGELKAALGQYSAEFE